MREESNEKATEKCYGLASGAQHLQILICGGTGCKASSSQGITDNLLKAIKKNEITDKVEVITVGCFGFCEKGPIVKIIPDNTFYTQVTPEDAEEIINEHIIGGRRIERLLYVDPKTEHTVSDSKHMDFYRKQLRIALRNCGFIDPENIEEYIAREGYFALADCLLNKQPTDVIDIIKRSGLRGRGGGGHRAGVRRYSGARAVGRAARKSAGQSGRIAPPGAYKEEKPMDQHSLTLQLRFQRLLAKLFPQELYYIGGPDPLPPPLSPEEEREMTRRLKNHDEAARATLIEHNLRLVVFISRRFENTGIPLEDLISIGTIGLIKAVGTFDCDKKIKMATYASRCIENEILMFLRKSSRLRLEVSLDEPLKTDWDGNELLLSDVLGTRPDTVSVNLDREIERDILRDALERLNPREKRIIMLRFGLGGQRERTQKEVADLLGISQSYISRLEKRILNRLNTELKRIG
mgnify:CR=1 FL=1